MQSSIDEQVNSLLAEMRQKSASKAISKTSTNIDNSSCSKELGYYLHLAFRLFPIIGGFASISVLLIAVSLSHFRENKASVDSSQAKDFSTEIQPESSIETVEKEVKHKIVCNPFRN